jgi:hypothetical protein
VIAFLTLGELGVLGANPLWSGEENRAKDAKDAKVKGMKDDESRYRDWALPTLQLSRHPPAASVVAGLTEPGGPRTPDARQPVWLPLILNLSLYLQLRRLDNPSPSKTVRRDHNTFQ